MSHRLCWLDLILHMNGSSYTLSVFYPHSARVVYVMQFYYFFCFKFFSSFSFCFQFVSALDEFATSATASATPPSPPPYASSVNQSQEPINSGPRDVTDDVNQSEGTLEFLGQEMKDLQQLLVTMASGKGIVETGSPKLSWKIRPQEQKILILLSLQSLARWLECSLVFICSIIIVVHGKSLCISFTKLPSFN